MTRGSPNGRGRPYRGRNFRGGRGRGGPDNRGRGGGDSGRGTPRGGGGAARGMFPGHTFLEEELGLTIHMYANASPVSPALRGTTTPRGGKNRGGRGGGQTPSNPNSGTATPNRARGGGRGRGRGQDGPVIGVSPRGRAIGHPMIQATTLSGLLYQERPLLRPIIFVPSILTKVLFKEEEEILQPVVEDVDDTDQAHVPTADRVSRVFSGGDIPRLSDDDDEEDDGEEKEVIEEIDFNDVGMLFDDNLATATRSTTTIKKSKLSETMIVEQERFTGFYVDPKPAPNTSTMDVDGLTKMIEDTLSTTGGESEVEADVAKTDATADALFFVDTLPTQVPSSIAPHPSTLPNPLRMEEDNDDDVIVYVAPHPRNSSTTTSTTNVHNLGLKELSNQNMGDTSGFTPYVPLVRPSTPDMGNAGPSTSASTSAQQQVKVQPPPSMKDISFSFASSTSIPDVNVNGTNSHGNVDSDVDPSVGQAAPARLVVPPLMTPRQAKAWSKKRGVAVTVGSNSRKGGKSKVLPRRKNKRGGSFGAFGALREEALLRGEDSRMSERRRGDSDLDWGDSDDAPDNEGRKEVEENADMLRLLGMLNSSSSASGSKAHLNAQLLSSAALNPDDGHGMQVDPDLDVSTMRSFVSGMLGRNAGVHTTMDDIGDEEMLRKEDEEEQAREGGSSDEDSDADDVVENGGVQGQQEDVVKAEEELIISETLQFAEDDDSEEDESDDEDNDLDLDEEDDDDDSDDDLLDLDTPRTSFQARLKRLREKARSRGVAGGDASFDQYLEYLDDDDDEDEDVTDEEDEIERIFKSKAKGKGKMTWAEQDDDFIRHMQDILDENDDILKSHGAGTSRKKSKNKAMKSFRAIRDGMFDLDLSMSMEGSSSPAKRGKPRALDLPAELALQWERDRQKKAERKEARMIARLEQASDPMAKKKGGKKGRKAMLLAASLPISRDSPNGTATLRSTRRGAGEAGTINVLPNRIIDLSTLVQQIKRFIADISSPRMSLPPTNKETRKNVHELALAFRLKSQSHGKGDARYTVLSRTSRTGTGVDEWKVNKVLRRGGGAGSRGEDFVRSRSSRGGGGGGGGNIPRHRDGDKVGHAAPKIGESNVGFRMLAQMGWTEGDRIGSSMKGIENPLTAIIKTTKAGLGASK